MCVAFYKERKRGKKDDNIIKRSNNNIKNTSSKSNYLQTEQKVRNEAVERKNCNNNNDL